ncbi:MAG: septal ring lytic transglycosylase RlpA family protein [Burkholderiales bacterium]|nr:septal ring lytic transglycosylase RlpA family protein [Burkholderiales bacterium]
MPDREPPSPLLTRTSVRQPLRLAASALLLAVLAACQTTPSAPGPGNVSRLPPGNAGRDGPEAHPPANLEAVPDAVPQLEGIRNGGPNKPYEIGGKTYTPLTDDRALTEKGLASWYGKKFHGRRTASGEAYNMYAMTAAHKTLPIPSYARVRNPANGKEVIVRVNDRGPFSPGRVIDLSYTAALKLGVLAGVTPVEVTRITADDIRTGAALRKATPGEAPAAVALGDLDRAVPTRPGVTRPRADAMPAPAVATALPPAAGDVIATAAGTVRSGVDAATPPSPATTPGVDLGAAAAVDAAAAAPGSVTTVSETVVAGPAPARAGPDKPDKPDEHVRADTTAGIGWWLQLGAFRQRDGALDFQRKLVDEQPWLAPLLAVFSDRGLNKLQAGPYTSRDEARSAADKVRTALRLVPTIVEKR